MTPKFLDAFLSGKTVEDQPTPEPASTPSTTPPAASDPDRDSDLEMRVVEQLRTIYDPEIPVNIYDLGLIYELEADTSGNVRVVMTLTTPHCPVAESMPGEVELKIRDVEGVNDVKVELVWDPPWDQTMLSEAARLELGFL
jgi:FeS assembly SUF system protein